MSSTCQNSSDSPNPESIQTFKSGQNFGFCMGKCYHEMIVSGQKVTLLQKEVSYPGNVENFEFNESGNLKKLQTIIEGFDTGKFLQLNETLGCPDCNDGGSEWLEITLNNGKTKRVTFEYGQTIPGFEEVVLNLRNERLELIKNHQ